MDICEASEKYERWLSRQITLLPADLQLKHQAMAQGPFPFLRATFYRWVQQWAVQCPDEAAAPVVLAVGDLHIENFGTWRDSEGRLIWGINDFDEAYPMPYTIDLVRLATSALVAGEGGQLTIGADDACQAILDGYTDTIGKGGSPFVLAQHHHWLREMAVERLRDPEKFWGKLDGLADFTGPAPGDATAAIARWMPEPGLKFRLVHRIAGLGSLGRQRFVAVADWRGGKIAREAKQLAVSAYIWEQAAAASAEILYQKILDQAVRTCDPYVHLAGQWIVRRLAPDCSRIELSDLAAKRDEEKLLYAMGQETANVHLGDPAVGKIGQDLKGRHGKWLSKAAAKMADAVAADCKHWQAAQKAGAQPSRS